MNTIEMNNATRMMFYHFMDGPEKYVSEDHKKLFWRFVQKDKFDVMEIMFMLDYMTDFPVTGNHEYIEGANRDFVVSQLEVVFQHLAIEAKMNYVDTMRRFADERAAGRQVLVDYIATNPVLPSKDEVRQIAKNLMSEVKKEIMSKLMQIANRGDIDPDRLAGLIGDRLGVGGPDGMSVSEDLESWGVPPVTDKRKLN